jgi:twitching motility two-component system response regulator PilH
MSLTIDTPKTILLVEDSRAGLMVEKMLLRKDRYHVITARDAQQGVAAALAERPDLVIMSAGMPQAWRGLREHESTRATPILFVTTKRVGHADANGCSDSLTKPIDGLELLSKVRRHLGEW